MPLDAFYVQNRMEYEHALSVGYLSYFMALRLGYDNLMSEKIQMSGFYHDIGKMCVPRDVLYKRTPLTQEDILLIQGHTDYGFQLLIDKGSDLCNMIAHVSLNHHERLDGSGYHGKKENEIGDVTKIVMVADVFDALISRRCYKTPYSMGQIRYIIEKKMAGQLCPEHVAVLKQIIEKRMEIVHSHFLN